MSPGLRSVSFVEIVQKDGWVTSGELCSNGVLSVERGNQNGATRHGGEEIAGLYDEIAEFFPPQVQIVVDDSDNPRGDAQLFQLR